MKRNIKLLLSLLFVAVIMFTACEEDERVYKDTDINNSSLATVAQISNIDELWAFSLDPELVGTGYTYTKYLSVKVLGAVPTTDANITFSIKASSTAVEGTHYILSNSSVITIPAGSNTGFVTVTIYPDEVGLGTAETIDWEITGGDLTLSDLGLTSSFSMFRNCPLDLNLFNGTFETYQDGYLWNTTVIQDPENARGIILYYCFWYGGIDSVKLTVDTDGIISAENQFINQDDHYGGLGRVMYEDIFGEVTNTCVPIFEYTTTPTLPDSGYWWGGPYLFILTKTSSKTDIEPVSSDVIRVPYKY